MGNIKDNKVIIMHYCSNGLIKSSLTTQIILHIFDSTYINLFMFHFQLLWGSLHSSYCCLCISHWFNSKWCLLHTTIWWVNLILLTSIYHGKNIADIQCIQCNFIYINYNLHKLSSNLLQWNRMKHV